MRRFIKNSILEIFQTMYEAHSSVKKMIDKKDFENVHVLLEDCQNTAVQVGTNIEASEGEGFVTVGYLEEYCEAVYEVAMSISDDYSGSKAQKALDKKLIKAENSVKNDIKVRLEIVFCPYKASMWDSLESVWKAAYEDPDCDAYVVPIPYYDRNPDRSLGEFHYEGGDLPDYVPLTHYEAYNFETRRPDVVYIHNPYDDCNYVTSVDPRFYSRELKKYTECLVYVPYFMAGYFNAPSRYPISRMPAVSNADKIVLQSEVLKNIYLLNGAEASRIITTGSPKLDKVINSNICEYPESWMKLKDRKVCLINSSLTSFLEWDNFIDVIQDIIDKLINKAGYSVLYRPHPLLESTISSMRPDKAQRYNAFCIWCAGLEHFTKDELPDSIYSISFSDMLISDYSSLVFSYIPTEKPVIEIHNGVNPIRSTTWFACDTRDIYYYDYVKEPVETLTQLVNDVLENDYLRDKRLNTYNNSVINSDGTSGIKTHIAIKRALNA